MLNLICWSTSSTNYVKHSKHFECQGAHEDEPYNSASVDSRQEQYLLYQFKLEKFI